MGPGDQVGLWLLLSPAKSPNGVGSRPGFLCRCTCGKKKVVPAYALRRGTTRGCFQCRVADRSAPIPFKNRIGNRFGRLVLLSAIKPDKARCLCDCGKETVVLRGNLVAGASTSCGCAIAESRVAAITHGLSRTPIYHLWASMVRRCHGTGDASKDIGLRRYRDRGITVCAGWRSSVESFLSDMGERPSDKHSIERTNNNFGYWCGKCDECCALNREPNCVWATQREQARNTSRNRWIEHDGRRMLAVDWALELGISRQRFEQRLRANMPPDRLFAPGQPNIIRALRGKVPATNKYVHNGKRLTIAGWARESGVSPNLISMRLKTGRTISEAISPERLPARRASRQAARFKAAQQATRVPEARPRKSYECSLCHGSGHNKATCSNQVKEAS